MAMEEPEFLSGLFLFLVLSLCGGGALFAVTKRAVAEFQIRLFLLAFSLRFAMALLLYQFGLIEVLKDEDGSGWVVGRSWYEGWLAQGIGLSDLPGVFAQSYQAHHKGYYYLLSIFFFLTGSPYRLPAAVLNCFVGALTVNIGYRTAQTLFSERIAVRVGWWLCFYPSLIVWSAQTIKEPVVILLESLVIYGCVALQQRGFTARHVCLILAAILLLVPFRFYAAYLAAATVVLSFVLGGMVGRRLTIGTFLCSIGIAGSALLLTINLLTRDAGENAIFQHYDLKEIESQRNYVAATTNSGVRIDYDLQSPGGFTGSVLIGGLHLLLAPFPWQLASGSLRMVLVAPEVLLWWWLLATGVVPGIQQMLRRRFRDILPLLIMLLGLGLLYSLTFSNVGLVYRQRAQLLPWLIIFAVVGRDGSLRRRRESAAALE